jgi:nucleoside 2-deoxyribosyltransferase
VSLYYHAIATLPGARQKSLVNKTEDQMLTECVIPYIRTGVIGARWGKKVQSYQVLEIRIYGTKEPWHKTSGTPLKRFIGRGARNRYPTFAARASKALSTTAHRVFVIMPIQGEEFGTQDEQRILKEYDSRFEAMEALLAKYDAVAIRIDREHTLDELVKRIKSEISKCQFVIADLTDERPSCYYEAGYAEALRKPVIFVASKESVLNPRTPTHVHFDIHRNVNFFVNNDQLKQKLRAAIDKNRSELFSKTSKDEVGIVVSDERKADVKRFMSTGARRSVGRSHRRTKTPVVLKKGSGGAGSRAAPSLNENEKAVLRVLSRAPGELTLRALAAAAFPKLKQAKANSWVRNSVRKPLRNGLIARVANGTYKISRPGSA